jgi:hypothetical protein
MGPVVHYIRINTLMVLPIEATIKKENFVSRYVSTDLEGVTLMYKWVSHFLTIRVGYNTSISLRLLRTSLKSSNQ